MEAKLYQDLNSDNGLMDLLNGGVKPVILPEHTRKPAIVYGVSGEHLEKDFSGGYTNNYEFGLTIIADDYDSLVGVAKELKRVLIDNDYEFMLDEGDSYIDEGRVYMRDYKVLGVDVA